MTFAAELFFPSNNFFPFFAVLPNFGSGLSDEYSLFAILYYSYFLPDKVCIVRASSRYKSMFEYFRRSYVHEWRFAFTNGELAAWTGG